jgi:hypothetical protein
VTVVTATYRNQDELEALLRRPIDERAARVTLRRQIAQLERKLGCLVLDLWNAGRSRLPSLDASPRAPAAGRLLNVRELEEVRDGLVERVHTAGQALKQRAEAQTQAHARLDAMLLDPAGHRFHKVTRVDLGEPSCGAYQVLPRLGLLGMLFGWWCVKLSSGCPLPMYYRSNQQRRQHLLWRRHARLELWLAIIVVVAVLATLAVFLLVYHDVPFRGGQTPH